MTDEMSEEDIFALLAEPDAPTRKSSPRRASTEDRTITGWFKVPHTLQRDCEVELHDTITDRRRDQGMTTIIKDVAVCRICFLASADKHG